MTEIKCGHDPFQKIHWLERNQLEMDILPTEEIESVNIFGGNKT